MPWLSQWENKPSGRELLAVWGCTVALEPSLLSHVSVVLRVCLSATCMLVHCMPMTAAAVYPQLSSCRQGLWTWASRLPWTLWRRGQPPRGAAG